MTVEKLINILNNFPGNCTIMSNSGWEGCETNINAIWYNSQLNEAHLTQGGSFETEHGYKIIRGKETYNFFCVYSNVKESEKIKDGSIRYPHINSEIINVLVDSKNK